MKQGPQNVQVYERGQHGAPSLHGWREKIARFDKGEGKAYEVSILTSDFVAVQMVYVRDGIRTGNPPFREGPELDALKEAVDRAYEAIAARKAPAANVG